MSKTWKNDRRHKHPDDATSKFERWIREAGGPSAVAKLLDVHHVTVGAWLARKSSPSLEAATKIIELSKGKLKNQDILEGTRAW